MNRLLNEPPDTPIGEVRALPAPPPLGAPLAELPSQAGDKAPEVAVGQANVTAAARRVEVAQAELKPVWSLGGSFFWQGNSDRVVSFLVGVELPLQKGRKQRPMIAAAERELEAARFDLQDASAQMRAEAARLVAEVTRADEQISRYRSGLLPQSSAALDAARASYLGGRGEFASVLDEFRRWTEIRVELVRRESSRFIAVESTRHSRESHRARLVGTRSREERHRCWEGASVMTVRSTMLALCLVLLGIAACTPAPGGSDRTSGPAVSKPLYQCPMHPEVVSDKPGDCPICGMRLVLVKDGWREFRAGVVASALGAAPASASAHPAGGVPDEMNIGADGARLAGVRTVEAVKGRVSRMIRATGTVAIDETRVRQVTTKVAGFVEKLYVNATGPDGPRR